MKAKILTVAVACAFVLTGCMQNGSSPWGSWGSKQTGGTAGGAVLGGLAGAHMGKGKGQLWTTGAGALLGAFIGSSIGQSLDRADQQYHAQAVEQAYNAPLNKTVEWRNPESGHAGSVTPVREGRHTESGNLCREYKQTIYIDGKSETAIGTACQNSDGTWSVVQS